MRVEEASNAEQDKILDAAAKTVKNEAFEMKRFVRNSLFHRQIDRSLDKGKKMDALKHASILLAELRTSNLTPKYYYRLYIDVVTELNHLESFLFDELEKENKPETVMELYESVQYACTIVPRMYLMITIGVVYMKLVPNIRAEILNDLVEMSRGVQHPLRGLFLRHYLLQVTKSLLPDVNGNEEPAIAGSGTVRDTIAFVKLNFSEMNKLWGPSREREKREKERLELRILVGTNLVRLSHLEHLTEDVYVKDVLPYILEQVVSCRDAISQEYLMECVIQVFADELHLATLNVFLTACKELQQEVHIKNVLIALIERLALFVSTPDGFETAKDLNLFEIFSSHATSVIQSRADMPIDDIVSLHAALVSLAVKCYSDNIEYANAVFASLAQNLQEKKAVSIEPFSSTGKELLRLLRIPVDEYSNVLRVALLKDYANAMAPLNYKARCSAASYILQNLLEHDTALVAEDDVHSVCNLVECLLVDQTDQPETVAESEEFADEQNLIARIVHLIRTDDPSEQFLLLNGLRKRFGAGGKWRIRHTLPPIVFAIYKLALVFAKHKDEPNWDAKAKKMFVCVLSTIGAIISTGELSELPLKLYLQGAVTADKVPFDENALVVYEFISKALSVFEDDIADSRERFNALAIFTNTLIEISCLPEESWEPLASQILLAGAKLFKKPDQVRSLCSIAHLFWRGKTLERGVLRDASKVAEILRKAAKIASQCMEPLVKQSLFIHLLGVYYYFYEASCETISADMIAELLSLTRDAAIQLDPSREADELDRQLQQTLQHIRATKDKHTELIDRLQL